MPINFHISANLPKGGADLMEVELAAGVIGAKLESQIQAQFEENPSVATNLIKSPAFFGIGSSFALKEYIKNSMDSGATKLDFYFSFDAGKQELMCAIVDNGPGFPRNFLKKSADEKGMVDYVATKLMSDDGEVKQHIQSTKRNIQNSNQPKQKGGQGLGLASIARILHTGDGRAEIGNVGDLSVNALKNLSINVASQQHGAVIMLTSTLFSEELFQKYQSKSYGKDSNDAFYVNYVKGIEFSQPSYDIASPTSIERSLNDSPSLSSSEVFSPSSSTSRILRSGLKININMKGLTFGEGEPESSLSGITPMGSDFSFDDVRSPSVPLIVVNEQHVVDEKNIEVMIDDEKKPLGLNMQGLGFEDHSSSKKR